MLTGLYHYNVYDGVMVVIRVIFVLVLLIAMRYSLQLFRALRSQDEMLSNGTTDKLIPQMATYFRSFIIYVIGYRGDKRERTPMHEVDSAWLASNWYYVFRRFLIFYSIYITFGILLTRPVYFEGSALVFYNYDRNNLNAIFYLLCYIGLNAIADTLSIYFTFYNLEKITKTGRVFFYGAFDFFLATIFFVPNQIASCFLWYVKRAENNIEFTGNLFATFFDLVFWPYALVGNVEANTTIGQLFPGQLIITGTVFFPTIAMISVLFLYRIFLTVSYYVKKALIFVGIDEFCKKYLEMNSISPFQFQPDGSFGYCNAALVLVFNGILISMLYDTGKALLNSFQG